MMPRIISCACGSFAYLLWRHVCPSPFLIGLSFSYWVIRVIYIFWILDPNQIYDLVPFCRLSFHCPESVCVRVLQRNTSNKKETYFKKLVHTNVGAGKSDIHRVGCKLGAQRELMRYSWGRISSFPETSGFALTAFNWLDEAHLHCGR